MLTAEGCDVLIPREQECCGALMIHAGEEEMALEQARRLIDVFEKLDVETVVVNAAGCGSSMEDLGRVLQFSAGLKRAGRNLPVRHMVELLDASIHGQAKEALLG